MTRIEALFVPGYRYNDEWERLPVCVSRRDYGNCGGYNFCDTFAYLAASTTTTNTDYTTAIVRTAYC